MSATQSRPVEITVIETFKDVSIEAIVPGNAPVGRIVPKLVTALELITQDPDGNPLGWHLHLHPSGPRLFDHHTLEDFQVADGAVLRLVPAGGCG